MSIVIHWMIPAFVQKIEPAESDATKMPFEKTIIIAV